MKLSHLGIIHKACIRIRFSNKLHIIQRVMRVAYNILHQQAYSFLIRHVLPYSESFQILLNIFIGHHPIPQMEHHLLRAYALG